MFLMLFILIDCLYTDGLCARKTFQVCVCLSVCVYNLNMCLIAFSGLILLDRSTRYVWFTRASSFRTIHRRWCLSTWLTTVFCTATSRSMPHERSPQGHVPLIRCMWHLTLAASWCLCLFLCSLCSGIFKFSTGSSSPHLPRPRSWALPSFLVLLHLGCTAVDGRFRSLMFNTYMFADTHSLHLLTSASCKIFWDFWTLQVCWRLWFQRFISEICVCLIDLGFCLIIFITFVIFLCTTLVTDRNMLYFWFLNRFAAYAGPCFSFSWACSQCETGARGYMKWFCGCPGFKQGSVWLSVGLKL